MTQDLKQTRQNAADNPVTLLGLGAMGTALARTWLAAGHPLTVWNRTASRADALVAEGAKAAATAAEAVAASPLIVVCLLDEASVTEALAGVDLAGKDVVDLTTGTPAQARARARWAEERGARFLDGGIMAVPPMIGIPEAGGYVFYSGSRALFDAHADTLSVPAGANFVGADPGFASLHDVALLSGMYGMFAGITHAFALVRGEADIKPTEFAPLLKGWLHAMSGAVDGYAERLESGDYTTGVVSNLAMQVAGIPTFLGTAAGQGVSTELLTPFFGLMERLLGEGAGAEDTARAVDLLAGRAGAATA
ncbi:NAD(P)-dependent oxidoreductase [Yinghuangia soli]|uniref:NAD(P)-binding domain-containing protein n=1 Tax=Yinghuangia soli TaxID=2908204 RepID=A0AA41Q858_9ACTN|nr:NAD(P)-binding domain-containing protein [Yinghuangia soli]MCF2533017.1 NAD(P)-binding domain-containing protein [Yinghuangia soli]